MADLYCVPTSLPWRSLVVGSWTVKKIRSRSNVEKWRYRDRSGHSAGMKPDTLRHDWCCLCILPNKLGWPSGHQCSQKPPGRLPWSSGGLLRDTRSSHHRGQQLHFLDSFRQKLIFKCFYEFGWDSAVYFSLSGTFLDPYYLQLINCLCKD